MGSTGWFPCDLAGGRGAKLYPMLATPLSQAAHVRVAINGHHVNRFMVHRSPRSDSTVSLLVACSSNDPPG
jgi:hypothetical protein